MLVRFKMYMLMHCTQDGGSSGTRYYTTCIQKSAFQATLWWSERVGNGETYKIEIILAMVRTPEQRFYFPRMIYMSP